MSPYSYGAAAKAPGKTKVIRGAFAGSVCIDYSMIGTLVHNESNDKV